MTEARFFYFSMVFLYYLRFKSTNILANNLARCILNLIGNLNPSTFIVIIMLPII